MPLPTVSVTLQVVLLTSVVLNASGRQTLTINLDRGTTLHIDNKNIIGPVCEVCIGSGISQKCGASVWLENTVSVEFNCPRPQDILNMEILRSIECTGKSCNGDIIQTEYSSTPLMDFSRTFTWNLKASAQQAFQLDFTSTGLRQISPSETCPDKHTYRLQALQATGKVFIGTYCRNGSFHGAQVLKQGSFSVQVPAKQKLKAARFGVSVGEEIKSLAKMKLILQEGSSSSELLSPNYPSSFPDDDQIEWEFQAPAKHNTTIEFLAYTQPRCMKKRTAVEFHRRGREASAQGLSITQPTQIQGNFTLTLRNCDMDRARANPAGLSLHFKLTTVPRSRPVLCEVDLRKEDMLSLYIEARPGSECEMKMNSNTREKITLPSKRITQLSFQDCPPEDVRVTARRIIACKQLGRCPKVSLAVPSLPSCLPAPLSNVTWTLHPPPHGAVELLSPGNPLRQSPAGQPCNDSIILQVAEDDGTSLGQFCPDGAIKKIQIHDSVSVTASGWGDKMLRPSRSVLLASFREEIRERYIFSVAPKKGVPTLLATPGWPEGMKSYATVSWIISVPAKQEAHLMFTNITQPKCSNRHTNIRVQSLGSLEEMYSRREDEEADSEITISKSFYLNMSNCSPERGHFSVVSQITLHKNNDLLLIAVLSVVAALLVIIFIVLGVVCVVIRKKKREMNHQVSIYNPNGASFLPGHNGLPKSPEEDDHIYASIEDSLVYTHLLRKGVEMGVYGEVDTYPPLTGPTDPHKLRHTQGWAPEQPEVGVYQPFVPPSLPDRPLSQGQVLVENDIYCSGSNSEEEDIGDLTRTTVLGPRMDPEGGD